MMEFVCVCVSHIHIHGKKKTMYLQDKLITALQQKLQAKQQEHSEIVKKLQGTSSLEKAYFQEQTRERVRMQTRIGRCCVSLYNEFCVRV